MTSSESPAIRYRVARKRPAAVAAGCAVRTRGWLAASYSRPLSRALWSDSVLMGCKIQPKVLQFRRIFCGWLRRNTTLPLWNFFYFFIFVFCFEIQRLKNRRDILIRDAERSSTRRRGLCTAPLLLWRPSRTKTPAAPSRAHWPLPPPWPPLDGELRARQRASSGRGRRMQTCASHPAAPGLAAAAGRWGERLTGISMDAARIRRVPLSCPTEVDACLLILAAAFEAQRLLGE
jgi:hypothetical protein